MSKAFTRESDQSDGEEVPGLRPQLPPGTRNYITREGVARLKRRLDVLLEQKRALTASEADRRKIETSIRKLQQVLDSVVVAELPADQEKAAFGARVVVRHGNGEEDAYRIVGVEEAEPEHGSISWLSPLARALLSRKAGDKVRFRSPGGYEELTIVSVDWPPATE